ncbi:MAG: VPLPA-CTERM sorting domain-containing protein [Pseudomonadota bacterium]
MTAIFEGTVSENTNLPELDGLTVQIRIEGDTDTPPAFIPEELPMPTGTFSEFAEYELTRILVDVAGFPTIEATTIPALEILDDFTEESTTETVDYIGTFGIDPGNDISIATVSTFDPGTFTGIDLANAVSTGFAGTTPLLQGFQIRVDGSFFNDACADPDVRCRAEGTMSLIDIDFGDQGSGMDDPPIIPLPASLPLLLAGLGGLGVLLQRRQS